MVILGLCLALTITVSSRGTSKDVLPVVELSSNRTSIKACEPLIIKLTYRYKEPQVSPRSDAVLDTIQHGAIAEVKYADGSIKVPMFPIYPSLLHRQDTRGLIYSGHFVLFYDYLDKKEFLFEKPGTYLVTLLGQEVLGANAPQPLTVSVGPPSTSEIRALGLLSDPDDYVFLEFGGHGDRGERLERISRLRQVIEQCGGTLLGRLAAARLGVEYFKQFHEKHPSFEKFKSEYVQGAVEEPLFELSYKYLTIGAELPDEFPIRPETLSQLSRVEYMRGNLKKAISLIDETAKKYPHTEYGRKAIKAQKEELPKLVEREQPSPALWTRVSLLIGAAAGMIILCLVLLLRRKARNSSQHGRAI